MTTALLHETLTTPVADLARQPGDALHRLQLDAGNLLAAVKAVVEHIQRAVDCKVADLDPPLCVPEEPLTEATLCDWIATALPGERLQYHQGLLLMDRSDASSPYSTKERLRIHVVAKRAWHACELGLVHLVSERVDPFVFRYLAVRARMTPLESTVRKQLLTPAH
jgi:hypothetical protein